MATKRVVMFGGWYIASDNITFEHASKNVIADYRKDMSLESIFLANGANQIVDYFNNQVDNTIQSLDLFCHGSSFGVHFSLNASKSITIPRSEAVWSHLYMDNFDEITNFLNSPFDRSFKDQHDIGELKLSAFTNACKIEIHGCSTAEKDSNFCTALSKLLYKKGKLRSVVIGHISKSNPNIRPNIKYSEQDYRHGKRGIYHNGKLLKIITDTGRITAKTINEALAGAA